MKRPKANPADNTSGKLLVVPQTGKPLSTAQQAFNRLVARIEKLHRQIAKETRDLDEAMAFFNQNIQPRRDKITQARKDLVLQLATFLDSPQLKKNQNETLNQMIAEQLGQIGAEDGGLGDEKLQQLFSRVLRVDYAQAAREELRAAREEFEELFANAGVKPDLSGFHDDMTPDEFQAEASRIASKFLNESTSEPPPKKKRLTKRQLEKEERAKLAEEARKRSIATIYKQLARVFHPDLEPDAALRPHKELLMQQLTAAYRNNDLHTMLRLEVEWLTSEKDDVQRLTDEKLDVYNEVLREQIQRLESQLFELPMQPQYRPITQATGPFQITAILDGRPEVRELNELHKTIANMTTQLQSPKAIDYLRHMIKEFRQIQKEDFGY